MALGEENIRVVTSLGAKCFVCDGPIKEGEKSIEVSFQLFLQVRKEMHSGECADRLGDLLKQRAFEARKK